MGFMRKARHLAPWHREAVGDGLLAGAEGQEEEMEVLLAGMRGKAAIYHCVSRVVNRDFVLHREEREHFVRLMRVYEKFSQVRVLSHLGDGK